MHACGTATSWQLPPVQIASGVGQLCVTSTGTLHAAATVAGCANSSQQQWTWSIFDFLTSKSGLCLTAGSALSGAPVQVTTCHIGIHGALQRWLRFPGGQVINLGAMRCLADPGGGGPGTALTLQDCYGEQGEVWGLN